MSSKNSSEIFRNRALVCERRAKEVNDAVLKREWQDLAMEWHAIASFSAPDTSELDENN